MSAAQVVDPCPFEPVVDLVFGRWTSHVLWILIHHGRQRFGDLRDQVPAITPKVLTERLRRLERDGFVTRTYHSEMPPRVEYEVTPLAKTLVPAFSVLAEWSAEHLGEVNAARRRYDAVSAK
ncbi:HxlR family transcriptional regulator [Mycobacterium tuberculosis]|nr:HxlR family transcriptional regulator [Mycobacterium tuberculosis]